MCAYNVIVWLLFVRPPPFFPPKWAFEDLPINSKKIVNSSSERLFLSLFNNAVSESSVVNNTVNIFVFMNKFHKICVIHIL